VLRKDAMASAEFVQRYKDLSGWPSAVEKDSPLLEEIVSTALDESFPGAILPRLQKGSIVYYAIGPTPQIWRELRPLLLSFTGKTVTDFSGLPIVLDATDPVEALIAELDAHAVAKLIPSRETAKLALFSLRRLRKMLCNMQQIKRPRPEPTSLILKRFKRALVGFDRPEAEICLDRLRRELRLDALNLRFLKVQLHASFGEWSLLRGKDFFESLCLTRRSLSVTCALIEALYRTSIGPHEGSDDIPALLDRFRREVRPVSGDLFHVLPPNASPIVLKAFALEATSTDTPRQDLIRSMNEISKPEPEGPFTKFWSQVKKQVKTPSLEPASGTEEALKRLIAMPGDLNLKSAKAVLLIVAEIGTLDAYRDAALYLERLSGSQRDELLSVPWLREIWRTIGAELGWRRIPEDWVEWLQMIPAVEFDDAYAIAERACEEWPIAVHVNDPAKIARLSDALSAVPDGVASERLLEALPLLVEWLRCDPKFPNRAMVALYENLLTILALNPGRSDTELAIAGHLIDALLSCGLDTPRYNRVLDDVLELARTAVGIRALDWILDTMEFTVIYPAADSEARQVFLYGMLDAMMPIVARMTPYQLEIAKNLGLLLGWQVEKIPAYRELMDKVTPDIQTKSPLGRLTGSSIAVHTLTESAGKQIVAMLTKLVPAVRVELNHDHVGTPKLKALARNADIFIIVTQSAKHAATDFIRCHRADKPLLFPSGKGSSSIVRAIEEYSLHI
jgi:hypothetical protein